MYGNCALNLMKMKIYQTFLRKSYLVLDARNMHTRYDAYSCSTPHPIQWDARCLSIHYIMTFDPVIDTTARVHRITIHRKRDLFPL